MLQTEMQMRNKHDAGETLGDSRKAGGGMKTEAVKSSYTRNITDPDQKQ